MPKVKKIRGIKISAVDLFCGAGGMTNGLRRAGIDVVAGFDIDDGCRYAYEQNNRPARFVHEDISNVSAGAIQSHWRRSGDMSARLLVGCPPCQPFSSANTRKKSGDPRRGLMEHFTKLAIETLPDFIALEEVPLVKNTHEYEMLKTRLAVFGGYKIWDGIVDCSQYGVPQSRKRLVMLAGRNMPVKMVPPTRRNPITVSQAIGNMSDIKAGEVCGWDRYHKSPNLSDTNMRRIRASKPGGSHSDWPPDVKKSSFKSSYCRMRWDRPAPTITTQCYGYNCGRFGHPSQDRAISLREAAILQGFPSNYEFVAPEDRVTFERVGRMIGNSVPPPLGRAIGMSFIEALRDHLEVDK